MEMHESITPNVCQICGASDLNEIQNFTLLPRITSDCRSFPAGGRLFVCLSCGGVQKLPDKYWLHEISNIYSCYKSYYQSGGEEQIVFDRISGTPRRRSEVILDRLIEGKYLSICGHALDVGCGNGVTLSAMSRILSGWSFSGYELDDSKFSSLSRIPRFAKLFTGLLEDLVGSFDLVTLIHSLEHFPMPRKVLTQLRKVLGDGKLFIEVANIDENPFDILVADHLLHFSISSLSLLLERSGFSPITVTSEWIPKEISALSRVCSRSSNSKASKHNGTVHGIGDAMFRRIEGYVDWLISMVKSIEEYSKGDSHFGIFGTSIAATWIASQMAGHFSFFVDEDESRVGKQHHGKPIYHPTEIPPGSTVYLSLAPKIASVIAKRLSNIPCVVIKPPDLVSCKND